ncbi:hypothetical protein OG754_40510 (plasmid) [Streptomyces decoyicus]|nr:hypothetical protein [Streptomyces decoyicus]
MPKKTDAENPYGYDPESNTVRVGQHDLARLLRCSVRWSASGRLAAGTT